MAKTGFVPFDESKRLLPTAWADPRRAASEKRICKHCGVEKFWGQFAVNDYGEYRVVCLDCAAVSTWKEPGSDQNLFRPKLLMEVPLLGWRFAGRPWLRGALFAPWECWSCGAVDGRIVQYWPYGGPRLPRQWHYVGPGVCCANCQDWGEVPPLHLIDPHWLLTMAERRAAVQTALLLVRAGGIEWIKLRVGWGMATWSCGAGPVWVGPVHERIEALTDAPSRPHLVRHFIAEMGL